MQVALRALGVGMGILILLGGIFFSASIAKAPSWKRDRSKNNYMRSSQKKITVPQAGTSTGTQQPTSVPEVAAQDVEPGMSEWDKMCHSTVNFNDSLVAGGTPWKKATASTFYIGEEAGPSNANITNISTAWSTHAVTDFGSAPDRWGPKDPESWSGPWYPRDGWCMKPGGNVVIRQNPFYVALPTPDYDEHGRITEAERWVAFASKYLPELKQYPDGKFKDGTSPFKNLWVAVEYKGKIALGQLEDIGPSDQQGRIAADYAFVWDPAVTTPKNTFGVKAGIDISPAMSDYLGAQGEAEVKFRFIPGDEVKKQSGPWTVLPTTGGPNW